MRDAEQGTKKRHQVPDEKDSIETHRNRQIPLEHQGVPVMASVMVLGGFHCGPHEAFRVRELPHLRDHCCVLLHLQLFFLNYFGDMSGNGYGGGLG